MNDSFTISENKNHRKTSDSISRLFHRRKTNNRANPRHLKTFSSWKFQRKTREIQSNKITTTNIVGEKKQKINRNEWDWMSESSRDFLSCIYRVLLAKLMTSGLCSYESTCVFIRWLADRRFLAVLTMSLRTTHTRNACRWTKNQQQKFSSNFSNIRLGLNKADGKKGRQRLFSLKKFKIKTFGTPRGNIFAAHLILILRIWEPSETDEFCAAMKKKKIGKNFEENRRKRWKLERSNFSFSFSENISYTCRHSKSSNPSEGIKKMWTKSKLLKFSFALACVVVIYFCFSYEFSIRFHSKNSPPRPRRGWHEVERI